MTENKKDIKKTARIFDGILIVSISIVFLLILFGVFKQSGDAVKSVLLGIFGLSIYGFFFSMIVFAIYHMSGRKILLKKRQIFDLILVFFFFILLLHLITITGPSYIRSGESFADGYANIIKRTFNPPTNSNFPETVGGILPTIILYPLAKLSIISEYILVVALLILCIISYVIKYVKFESKSKILSKFKRKDMENISYGEELYTGDIKGNSTKEDFVQVKNNKNIKYTTIEEHEKILSNDIKKENTEQQENKKEIITKEKTFIDPTAGNIKTDDLVLTDKEKERKRSFDILFNNLDPNDKEEIKEEEIEEELSEKDKALRTLYPQYHKEEKEKSKKENKKEEVKKPKTKENEIKEKILKSYTTNEMINYIHENIEVGNIKNNKKEKINENLYIEDDNNFNIDTKDENIIDQNTTFEEFEKIYEKKNENIYDKDNFLEEDINNNANFAFEPIILPNKNEEKKITEIKEKEIILFEKYVKPKIEDLDIWDKNINQEDVGRDATIIEKLLDELCNIKDAKVVNYIVGPTFTRYEIDIPLSTSVSIITNKEKDIQMRLAAESIKIQAPIPGKNYVGIEVPNKIRSIVGFREIVESSKFQNSNAAITCAVGQDVDGKNYVIDIAQMPHLLIAGGTGSGKSVGINALLCSILFKHSPEDVRLILIDPKQVELAAYSGLPHMLIPETISDTKQVLNALDWAINEMEERYILLKKEKCQKISQYNAIIDKNKTQKMPYILIVIDEVNDIMLRVGKSFEEKVTILAQKARAAGIHIVLATQRPSKEVITGTIKANLPAAIAYATSRVVDSIIILGESGAEKLLGKGDLIYKGPTEQNGIRIQGCFIDNHEIRKITDFVKENNKTYFDRDIEDKILKIEEEDQLEVSKTDNENDDPRMEKTFREVLQFCINQGRASASSIQSEFGMGFPKAARYINYFDKFGYIQKQMGNKGSEVVITQEQFNQIFGQLID